MFELLSQTPRPPGCVAMVGEQSTYRVRIGGYRIVYELHDRLLLVQVVRVGHRRSGYCQPPCAPRAQSRKRAVTAWP